jgi:putative ABC transport system substrate-binding protein
MEQLAMRRRQAVVFGSAAALATSSVARAQTAGKAVHVGFLYPGLSKSGELRLAALREGMRDVGYRDGEGVEFLTRAAEGDPAKIPALVADLVERKVDLLVVVSLAAVRAANAATSTIPIVAHDLESDPVASGLVASLARPGGNVTGLFADFPDIPMKWLEMLKEVIPGLSKVVVLYDPASSRAQLDAVQAAGRQLNVRLDVLEVSSIAGLERAFDSAAERRPDAVIILTSPIFGTDARRTADLALARHLPTATLIPEIARAGGLIAFGPNLLGSFRQLGTIVARVLHGARPADVPVERPTKFEMVINQKTAKALGLALPPTFLARADEVIE